MTSWPLAAAEAAKAREAEEKARAERLAAEALALRQLAALIGKANGALRDGNTGRAAGLRHAIEEKLPALPAVPAHLASQVQQLDLKLNELKEWKDYAVAPKRAELIEEMTALIGASYRPQALADRIKQLQEDWKTISKGIISDSAADWQRFQQASAAAYQPCREYFEAQAKQRQANLEKRKGRARAPSELRERPGRRALGLAGGGGRIARGAAGIAPVFTRGARRGLAPFKKNSMPRSAGCRRGSTRGMRKTKRKSAP